MRILLGFDGSEQSQRAAEWAARLAANGAAAGDNGQVTFLCVLTTLAGSERIHDAVDPTLNLGDLRARLAVAERVAASAGVATEVVETAGNPAEEIIRAAEASDCDLVVLGAYGRGAIQRFLLGSVSDRVVRHAPCPVLVVR
jgi:nucleotide-binding universal stress UspA family protein